MKNVDAARPDMSWSPVWPVPIMLFSPARALADNIHRLANTDRTDFHVRRVGVLAVLAFQGTPSGCTFIDTFLSGNRTERH